MVKDILKKNPDFYMLAIIDYDPKSEMTEQCFHFHSLVSDTCMAGVR